MTERITDANDLRWRLDQAADITLDLYMQEAQAPKDDMLDVVEDFGRLRNLSASLCDLVAARKNA